MISKFLSKLKSILFKSAVSTETPLKKEKKTTKSAKSTKTKTKSKTKTKTKTKKTNSKKSSEILTTLPGVGAKSAKALYEAGFKTTKSVIEADEKELLAVSGVGINLVKKLKNLK
jgi:ERCC4-type nuclease